MTTVAIPTRSLDQRMAALEIANAVRITQAAWCRELRELPTVEGIKFVARAVASNDERVARLKLTAALQSIQKSGIARTRRLLVEAGLRRPEVRMGDLAPTERRRLLRALGDWLAAYEAGCELRERAAA